MVPAIIELARFLIIILLVALPYVVIPWYLLVNIRLQESRQQMTRKQEKKTDNLFARLSERFRRFRTKIQNPEPIHLALPWLLHLFGGLYWIFSLFLISRGLRNLKGKKRVPLIEGYIWIYTGALVGLFVWSIWHPLQGPLRVVVLIVVIYRLVEMLVAAIDLLMTTLTSDARTGTALVVIYLIQTLLCFTLLAETYGRFSNASGPDSQRPVDRLFMIWGYISTIGTSYAPKTLPSFAIAMLAGVYSLMLLGVFLAYAIGNISSSGAGEQWDVRATYEVNAAAVAKARKLIESGKYVVHSDWATVQRRAEDRNGFIDANSWEEYAECHIGLTAGAHDRTQARYVFVYGEFRRLDDATIGFLLHRSALIACVYRAAQGCHKKIELAAFELLQYLDEKINHLEKTGG